MVQFLAIVLQNFVENSFATLTTRNAERLALSDSDQENGLIIPFVIVLSIQTVLVAQAQFQNFIDIIQ